MAESEYTDRGRKKGRLFVGVRHRRKYSFSTYTSTLVATIYVGNLKWNKLGDRLFVDGRLLLSPHLYVAYWPMRAGLLDLAPGYYVQPGQYSVPEGRFKNCFVSLDQAVAHGRALMKETLAAQLSLHAMGILHHNCDDHVACPNCYRQTCHGECGV